mgnify:FL=1
MVRDKKTGVGNQGSGEGGFSLIEIIITLVVLSIAAVGVLSVFTTGIKGSANPLILNQAIALAQERMDTAIALKKSGGFNAVQDIVATSFAAPFANFSYAVDATCVDSNFANPQGGSGYNADGSCSQAGATRYYKLAVVTVSWTGDSVVLTTVVANY